MLDGVERELPLPDPQAGDGDAEPNTSRHAPHDLSTALDAFGGDEVLVTALGAELANCFVRIKRGEWERWSAAVTDWEHQQYGRLF